MKPSEILAKKGLDIKSFGRDLGNRITGCRGYEMPFKTLIEYLDEEWEKTQCQHSKDGFCNKCQ